MSGGGDFAFRKKTFQTPKTKKAKSATDADEDEDVALLRASQAEQRAEQLQYNLSATSDVAEFAVTEKDSSVKQSAASVQSQPSEQPVTTPIVVDSVAQLKSIVEDSLHHEIEALVGVKHGESIVQSLKEAAVTFLKRSKSILLATESAPPVEAAAESSGKRKRADESEDAQVKENPEDERNRRRLERAKQALEALRAEQERWKALEREQFSASEAAAADAATTSKQHTTAVLDETRQAIASAKLNTDEARRAFESISMNLDTVLPLARDVNECVASIGGAQRAMAERVRAYGFAPFESAGGGDARVLVKEKTTQQE